MIRCSRQCSIVCSTVWRSSSCVTTRRSTRTSPFGSLRTWLAALAVWIRLVGHVWPQPSPPEQRTSGPSTGSLWRRHRRRLASLTRMTDPIGAPGVRASARLSLDHRPNDGQRRGRPWKKQRQLLVGRCGGEAGCLPSWWGASRRWAGVPSTVVVCRVVAGGPLPRPLPGRR